MTPIIRSAYPMIPAVVLSVMVSVVPAFTQPIANGRTIVVSAPEPKRLVLALDELELDWAGAGDSRTAMPRDIAPVPGAFVMRRIGLRATLTLPGTSEPDLMAVFRAAES